MLELIDYIIFAGHKISCSLILLLLIDAFTYQQWQQVLEVQRRIAKLPKQYFQPFLCFF